MDVQPDVVITSEKTKTRVNADADPEPAESLHCLRPALGIMSQVDRKCRLHRFQLLLEDDEELVAYGAHLAAGGSRQRFARDREVAVDDVPPSLLVHRLGETR